MPRKPSLDPRKLMELAVDVMRQSVQEPRKDGKANPKVGAVLWKPDGTVEKACRCELRRSDHAEYTLLERKNLGNRLDGSILFTTLEPCAPGSRGHPKLSCAERIVLARIKEVWVGVADPDPTVDRKGIKYVKNRAEQLGLPLPRYAFEDPYLVLTLFRNQEAALRSLANSVQEALTEAERKGWQWFSTKGKGKSGQYAKAMQIEDRTARRHLNRFVELGLVRKTGSGPSTEYEAI